MITVRATLFFFAGLLSIGATSEIIVDDPNSCGTNDARGSVPSEDVMYAREGQYPWHVGVYEYADSDFRLKCAGTILSAFVVIVDSNCVDRNALRRYIVVAGSTNSSSAFVSEHVQKSRIFKIVREEHKTVLSSELIVLKRRLKFTRFVRPVCLVRPDVRSSRSVLEVPFWEEDDYRLKTRIVDETSNCDLRHLQCVTHIPNRNRTRMTFGRVVRPTDTERGTLHYLLGYQTEDRRTDGVGLSTTYLRDTTFFERAIDKYDVSSSVMSECVVPDRDVLSPHYRGQVVLEATGVSYACDARATRTDVVTVTAVCGDGEWVYPNDVSPACTTQ